MAGPCRYCNRPLSVCREPVDQRFPQAAREAYACAGLTHAYTCQSGERTDLVATGGWCWSRARRHRGWSGPALNDEERRGIHETTGRRTP